MCVGILSLKAHREAVVAASNGVKRAPRASQRRGRGVAGIAVALVWIGWAIPVSFAQECASVDGGAGVVVEIVEQQLLVLDDARVIRLAGIRFPRFAQHGGVQVNTGMVIRETLVQHALGKKVKVRHAGSKTDRYGRHLAFIEIGDQAGAVSLQRKLVEMGLAQVDTPIEARQCAAPLLIEEDKARLAGAGFWAQGLFAIRNAADGAMLRGLIGTFQIVQGVVADTTESRGAVTLTFGAGQKSAFSVLVDARTGKLFTPPALGAAKLKGRSIRVRGWLIYRNGPSMQITHPEQLELLADKESGESGSAQHSR